MIIRQNQVSASVAVLAVILALVSSIGVIFEQRVITICSMSTPPGSPPIAEQVTHLDPG